MKHFFLHRSKEQGQKALPHCSMIVPAAGSSQRMGGTNKLLIPLGDHLVLEHTLLAIQRATLVDEIILAVREEDLLRFADLCKALEITKPLQLVRGGSTRIESVLCAATQANKHLPLLAIHDAARPLITPEFIDKIVAQAAYDLAVAPALPVKDTIKVAHHGIVQSTPDRSTLFSVQTPQVFDAALLKAALHSAKERGNILTDDCSAVELLGKQVHLIDGPEENIKITTPFDIILAEAFLRRREEEGI